MSATVDEPRAPEATAPGDEPTVEPPRRRRRTARRIAFGILVVLVVLVVAAGWLAFRGYQAGTALLSAKDVVVDLRSVVGDGDTQQIEARLPEIQADLAAARRATSDPVWRVAEHVPWVGAQLEAVRVVSVSLDDVVRDALPAVGRIDDVLHAQEARGTDGRIDLAPLVEAAPDIAAAAASAHTAQAAVAAIDTEALVPQLAGPVTQLQDGLAQVTGALDAGAQVAALLPPMLGVDGPRTYLLVSLNSSELRSAGGIVGAFAVLKADDGTIDLTEQRTTADLPGIETSILPLSDEELRFDTDRLGRWVQNAVMTPDFPRSAELLTARWERDIGTHVDGVIATDPVAVSYLLGATGAVTEPSGQQIDAGNVLQVLLRDAYLTFGDDAAAGDAFYTGVASTIFRAVGAGQGDSRAVVDALARAGAEGRLRMWSAHPEEQKRLVATSVGAAFLTGPFPDATGVFLNDGTAGKLGYYLSTAVTVEDLRCDGPEPTATVRLDLDYRPPADVATFPRYVTGWSFTSLPTGWLATNITVYAPVGAPLEALGRNEGAVSGGTGQSAGRNVQVVTSWLEPGARETYRFDVPVRDGRVDVWTTPTLTSPGLVTATCSPGE
ncbi:DUF4012 domain-containing protein [Cellulomonas sp. Root137]|uniref:DUF4012 domain-containing protein n=1 Tax=Cellulomonas sp. Root137 TaxID=1736459 RepID=UPI0006FEFD12|nr:DUF4012 domain-containing protein [Cellulomonas sp. Root137]KQY42828.1 hypothetical protein ASD18_17720 [Cellulomonas sp. Root137]